jgi:predicted RNase H-like nuclease (RuvC/YqgF family)
MTKTNPSNKAGTITIHRNRRTHPSRQRIYIRLRARVDRLEDAISHFYNVIDELRRRVSTLEKKLKPLAKDKLN